MIKRPSFWCAGLRTVGIPLVGASISFGQETGSTSQEANPAVPVVMEVIVTGSNIPTAEQTGPNPVDTYRREDIEKLGIHNTTDLLTKLPQEMGSTVNQNASASRTDDGAVIPNLRGLLPKETLVLIDGKRAAISGGGGVDKFRIKIWDKNNGGAIVYDNVKSASDDIDTANPQALGGGSIVIHK